MARCAWEIESVGDSRKRSTHMLKNNLVEAFHATHAFKWDPNKGFRLASGLTSPYYVDCRALMAQPSAQAVMCTSCSRSRAGALREWDAEQNRKLPGLSSWLVRLRAGGSAQSSLARPPCGTPAAWIASVACLCIQTCPAARSSCLYPRYRNRQCTELCRASCNSVIACAQVWCNHFG